LNGIIMSIFTPHHSSRFRLIQPSPRLDRISRRAAGMARVALPFSLVFGLGSCGDQAKPNCIATTNPFAVKLIELSREGACDTFGPATFNALPEVGLSPYYERGSDGQPDYERGSLAVQSAELGSIVYAALDRGVANTPDGQLYSFGAFNGTEPDDNNICTVPTLSPTRVVLPEIAEVPDDPATMDADESLPAQPAVDVTLDWSNVRVYVTADVFGTQMDGDLVDTRVTATGESCSITYRALGLAPAVACGVTNEDGSPATNPDGSLQLDPSLCEPEADPAAGRPIGSGIGPSARFECNPETAFCMIEGDTFPALR
jgi:hypothetical protein